MQIFSNLIFIRRYCFAILMLFGVVACSSAPDNGRGTQPLAQGKPLIYVSSLRSPRDVGACLRERLPNVRASRNGNMTQLDVGQGSWVIVLAPSSTGGTIVRVGPPARGAEPKESEMRFHMARCLT